MLDLCNFFTEEVTVFPKWFKTADPEKWSNGVNVM